MDLIYNALKHTVPDDMRKICENAIWSLKSILTDILQTGVFFNKKKPQLLFVAQVAEV